MITTTTLAFAALSLGPQVPAGQGAPMQPLPRYTLPESEPRPEFWVTNNVCMSAAFDGDLLYLGGLFSHVGPFTGPFAVVGSDSAELDPAPPKFDGTIHAVVGDNLGGWFVGGDFSRVGSLNLSGVVHILADGTVDTNFAPQVDGVVDALRLAQGWLYVAGRFMHIGGQAIPSLARVATTSGSADPIWHPMQGMLGSQNVMSGLAIGGNRLYAYGYFDTPAVLPRRNLAAFDLGTGVLLPWNPDPDSSVLDLIVSGSTVFVGGNFMNVGGAPRSRLAALDLATGGALALNPNPNSTVRCIGLSGTTLYAGGLFTMLGGQARGRGGAVDTSTGAILPWDAAVPGGNGTEIADLLIRNGSVYVSGKFASAGGQARWNLAQLDGITGNATSWKVDVAGPNTPSVDCLANQGPLLALGGTFRTVGGEAREGAAALNRWTGQLTAWHPTVWGSYGPTDPGQVHAILPTSTGIYLGGVFATVGGSALPGLALVDKVTAAPLASFHPANLNGFVRRLLLEGNRLYCGGGFAPGSGAPNSLVALDPTSGAFVAPALGIGGTVYDMAFSTDRTRLYVCGQFSSAGTPPVTRNSVACFDLQNGAVLPWHPQLGNGMASGLFPVENHVYLVGTFGSIAGQPRQGLARVDTANGGLQPWAPTLQGGTPDCVLALGWTVFIGGGFNSVNMTWQPRMAALDSIGPGLLGAWTPQAAGCGRFHSDGIDLVALGTFFFPDGSMRPNYAVYRLH